MSSEEGDVSEPDISLAAYQKTVEESAAGMVFSLIDLDGDEIPELAAGETVPAGQELSDSSRILLEYSFDSKGNLLTEYLSGEGTSGGLAFSDKGPASVAEDGVAGNAYVGMGLVIDDAYSIYSTYMDGADKAAIGECIVINDGSGSFTYAVPEKHADALGRGNVQAVSADEIFQMTVDETGVNIFKLGKQTSVSMEEASLLGREVDGNSDTAIAPYASYKTMSTSTIRTRMDTYMNLLWVYNSTRNSNASVTADPGKVSQPGWITRNGVFQGTMVDVLLCDSAGAYQLDLVRNVPTEMLSYVDTDLDISGFQMVQQIDGTRFAGI